MKTRFSTLDIAVAVHELQAHLGLRVQNVYDVDRKTYIIRLQKPDFKVALLIESGSFVHVTTHDWPKQTMPSSFSMKLRKHIKQRRLEAVRQLGIDRIIQLTFGGGEHACHVLVELYDRGNIVLTDANLSILNVLRPRTDKDADVRYAVRETYPVHLAKQSFPDLSTESVTRFLESYRGKPADQVRRAFVPLCSPGPAVLEHCLIKAGLPSNLKMADAPNHVDTLVNVLMNAQNIFEDAKTNGTQLGLITEREETKGAPDSAPLRSYQEFHPILFAQHEILAEKGLIKTFELFNAAVDEFISKMESQKIDVKAASQERTAMKKLESIRQDHFNRIEALKNSQEAQAAKGALIEANADLVDRALLVIRSAVANQVPWPEIQDMLDEAKDRGDPVASVVDGLKLETNHITLCLETDETCELVDLDLALGAHANARKFYTGKKQAAHKERKTLAVSEQALKNAEKKTAETLKQVQVKTQISKTRKPYWFEKFFWFISSEGYVVIGGRDMQQNEVIVKRYLKPGDVYVHADLRGASSVVVKNKQSGGEIPPKTLNEAGAMAICYSAAWDAKVVAAAWWVYHDQVSKTAPSGEYLTTGSFMIRGKKNPLPPSQLVVGFGLLFRRAEPEERTPFWREAPKDSTDEQPSLQPEADDPSSATLEDSEIQIDDDGADSDQDRKSDSPGLAESTDIPQKTNADQGDEASDVHEEVLEHSDNSNIDDDRQNLSPQDENDETEKLEQQEEFPDVEIAFDRTVSIDARTRTESASTGGVSVEEPKTGDSRAGPLRRGNKGKLKKMKEKYKDQDEEERELRLKLLGSTGKPKEAKKKGKSGKSGKNQPQPQKKSQAQFIADRLGGPQPRLDAASNEGEASGDLGKASGDPGNPPAKPDEADDAEQEERLAADLSSALVSLTPDPELDEELLFALPVCAPYGVLTNYKFKVKLTPGTGKKSAATKTAATLFLKDAGPVERELIKALDNQDMCRNFPGKVKVSAPQLSKK